MSRGAGHGALQDCRVDRQDGSGDARHTDRHGREQAGAAHGGEIGPHQQRRLHHADKDVGRRRRADRPGNAERPSQRPADSMHDARQHAPMVEQLGQRADHQDQRQRVKCEDERIGRLHRFEGRRRAGKIAEHQPHARAGRRLQRADQSRRPIEGDAHRADVEHDSGNQKLHAQSDRQEVYESARADGGPVLGDRPSNQRKHDKTGKALRLQHATRPVPRHYARLSMYVRRRRSAMSVPSAGALPAGGWRSPCRSGGRRDRRSRSASPASVSARRPAATASAPTAGSPRPSGSRAWRAG